MRSVLDASALVAALLDEPGAALVYEALDEAMMSSVNLAEVVARLAKGGNSAPQVRRIIKAIPIFIAPPDEELAIEAGLLRQITDSAGLSLGDRFCLSLARRLSAPVLTADRNWEQVADQVGVTVRLIR